MKDNSVKIVRGWIQAVQKSYDNPDNWPKEFKERVENERSKIQRS